MTHGGVPASGGVLSDVWIKIDGIYYYCRGEAPDGSPRLAPLNHPPYGKTVYGLNSKNGLTVEKLPYRLRTATTVILAAAALALVLIPLALAGSDPILAWTATPVAVGALLLLAVITQTAHLRPHDAISAAEAQQAADQAYINSEYDAAERRARQQAASAHNTQQWQAAVWAQTAQINQTLNPGTDTYRPYGQSPPL
ncbi:hypothetical protein E6R60_26450 [Streptomyces sp. A0642]|uniref:hypothetical protein n=1 Tax=Streptomyces sp. A0642 TaxID=2563100 RepID=UPI0010A27CC8|nr:hypothetical protein [Streptomyces sp. A0642]THA72474.1 hypothetical protein E6R60_26450 [Streptomyces sp. A0642]